jgi:peptidoglycan/xylan/chitin deacetylase (PgdA/CDA1 family)
MKRHPILIAFVVVIVALIGWYVWRQVWPAEIYRFSEVSGPEDSNQVRLSPPLNVADFEGGGPNRIAVLVTDSASDWMGLVRGFKSHGIPATFTTDASKALQHQVIFAYPSISGQVLSQSAIKSLAEHIRTGGTVLTSDLAGGGLEELFGIRGQLPSRERRQIRWAGDGDPADLTTVFSSSAAEAKVGSLGIAPTTAQVLARYEDGTAAAVCRSVGGRACIIGVDPGSAAQRAMNGRSEKFSPDSVNTYQPGLDVLFRWIRDIYVEGEDQPFLIGTAPAGKEGSLVLTHDVDFTRSVDNSVTYAESINRQGVSATFLIQTRYVRDWGDDIFFNHANLPKLKKIAETMEIGSHSVSHSRQFATLPLGTGKESYPGYRPFVENAKETRDASIFGETRVSRFLLEKLVGTSVSSFRPGHLFYPEALPDVLAATGYRYSSGLTANSAQTHLPFRLTQERGGAAFLPVWEFPVSIEDEKTPRLIDRYDAAKSVINKITAHGGVAVILIHPDITGHKLEFEMRLIQEMRNRLWIGSLRDFGNWWKARDDAEIDFDGRTLTLAARTRLNALDVHFPKMGKRVSVNGIQGQSRMAIR